jgi:hypothetical protein
MVGRGNGIPYRSVGRERPRAVPERELYAKALKAQKHSRCSHAELAVEKKRLEQAVRYAESEAHLQPTVASVEQTGPTSDAAPDRGRMYAPRSPIIAKLLSKQCAAFGTPGA